MWIVLQQVCTENNRTAYDSVQLSLASSPQSPHFWPPIHHLFAIHELLQTHSSTHSS